MTTKPDRTPASGMPARGYTWPPFEKGNTAAMTHGARSPRTYGPLAALIAQELLEDDPLLAANPGPLITYATAKAQEDLLSMWLDLNGHLTETGDLQVSILERMNTASNKASKASELLGLDPRSYYRLLKARADAGILPGDLEEQAAVGREQVDAWMAEQAALAADQDDDQAALVAAVHARRRRWRERFGRPRPGVGDHQEEPDPSG